MQHTSPYLQITAASPARGPFSSYSGSFQGAEDEAANFHLAFLMVYVSIKAIRNAVNTCHGLPSLFFLPWNLSFWWERPRPLLKAQCWAWQPLRSAQTWRRQGHLHLLSKGNFHFAGGFVLPPKVLCCLPWKFVSAWVQPTTVCPEGHKLFPTAACWGVVIIAGSINSLPTVIILTIPSVD